MATNAEIAAKLLRGAATFFRTLAQEHPDIREQMNANAHTYDVVADRVEIDPLGDLAGGEGDGGAAAD